MYPTDASDERTSRRRFLSAAGLAGGAALAGCLGGSEANPSGDGAGDGGGSDAGDGSGDDASAGGDCGDVLGTPRPFDVGDRPFVFVFEYPDTWEPYNQGLANDERAVDAFLGHSRTATGATYPMAIYLNQRAEPRDEETIATWLDPPAPEFEVTRTLEYDGQELDVAFSEHDERAWSWRLAVPSTGGRHPVSFLSTVASDQEACASDVVAVVTSLLESMRPNPDYVA